MFDRRNGIFVSFKTNNNGDTAERLKCLRDARVAYTLYILGARCTNRVSYFFQ